MTARSPITTHILDVALGKPAAGVLVTLARLSDGDSPGPASPGNSAEPKAAQLSASPNFVELGRGTTNDDGRVTDLLAPGAVPRGTYRISFAVAPYFQATGRTSFYPHVDVVFAVEAPSEHYHVPLLLSPFGYSTYRGS